MNKTLYFVECTCIKECSYPNINFHIGEVFYFNNNAAAREMNLFKMPILQNIRDNVLHKIKFNTYVGIGNQTYLPFTRNKKSAKKWQIKKYANIVAHIINLKGEFNAVVKEIAVTYIEKE